MSDFDSSVTYLPVPGYPGYLVGDDGSVWSCKNGNGLTNQWRCLVNSPRHDGYVFVALSKNNKRWTLAISRLVLTIFVGPCPPGMEACHKDDDRGNNRLSNLEWDTRQNNIAQRDRRGRQAKGEQVGLAKLKSSDIPNVFVLSALGFSQRRIARLMGVSKAAIERILARKNWKHAIPSA